MNAEAQQMIEHIVRLIRKPGVTIDENTPLVSSGLIDSMSLVDLLLKLEDLTQKRIPAGKVQPTDMDTVAKMFATAEGVEKPRREIPPLLTHRFANLKFLSSRARFFSPMPPLTPTVFDDTNADTL